MKPIQIPKLTDHSATLAELERSRDEVGALYSAKVAEQLAVARNNSPDAPPTDPAAARVAELMGEPPPKIVPERREILARLAKEAFDLKGALSLLDNRILVERTRAAAIVREVMAPEWQRRLRAVCAALLAVHDANESLVDLATAMDEAGAASSAMQPQPPAWLGSPHDSHSQLAYWLREAAAAGVIKAGEIPRGLVHK
jgi:hypothetical protein